MREDLPAPPVATFTVYEIAYTKNLINYVIAEVTYPYISITHTMKISRKDILTFLRSGDRFLYQDTFWSLEDSGLITPVEKSA